MAQEKTHFPYQLSEAFLTSLRFSRQPEMPEPLKLRFHVQASVVDDRFPNRLQINLRFETIEEASLPILVELVGLFDLVEGQPEPEHGIIWNFVNERALFMLWPIATQAITQITGQMGVKPVKLRTPHEFGMIPREKTAESVEG